ncbi:MAG TPA: alkaline phosphatase family protein [Candidatus Angelobacter sp.]|nr:alkaline phosphatase family protein [Candidatus Angelobacter sp.]
MQFKSKTVFVALLMALAAALGGPRALRAQTASATATTAVPHYDHIFLMVFENHGLAQIIGNSAAPNINKLANTFGLATNYFSVADPSEPNYVAMLGGNFFAIADDNAYYINVVNKPSLMSQMDAANLTWKGYLQGMPYAGFRGICYPVKCNGVPDLDALYAAKHNGITNFDSIQDSDAEFGKMGPFEQLSDDLAANTLPNFGYIIPDQCNDMHGAPSYCIDGGTPGDPQDQQLVTFGDNFVGKTVAQITGASFWNTGNNAIVITFDEGADGDTSGCCDANPGTGRVATVVITNNGPRGLKDPTPYNHFSLLQTMQDAFRLGCLEFTCDTANVTPMAPLFAVKK